MASATDRELFTDVYLHEKAEVIGFEWRRLGIYLELTHQYLDGLEYCREALDICAFKMLIKWRNARSSEFHETVRVLQKALEDVGRKDLSEVIGKDYDGELSFGNYHR